MSAQLLSSYEYSQYVQNADSEIGTPMIYTHVLNRGGKGLISPADYLRNAWYAETV